MFTASLLIMLGELLVNVPMPDIATCNQAMAQYNANTSIMACVAGHPDDNRPVAPIVIGAE